MLNYEELVTVLCDCEATINSRPLTYLSDYPDDLAVLTPAMFIQDIKETGVPDLDLISKQSLTKRVKYLQRLRSELRQRFRLEYLGQLEGKNKVKKASEPVKISEIVYVSNDKNKRLDWPLA